MTWPASPVPRRDHCGVRGWLVLDEVLAASGDATAAAFRRESPRSGSSPVAKAAAEELRGRGATVTRNPRAQWVADPRDPVVIAWRHALAGTPPSSAILHSGRPGVAWTAGEGGDGQLPAGGDTGEPRPRSGYGLRTGPRYG